MMDLSDGAFFASYLKALSLKQLEALSEWQSQRLAESKDEKVISDAIEKKRAIYLEIRSRRGA